MCTRSSLSSFPFPLIARNHLALYFKFLYLVLKLNDGVLKARPPQKKLLLICIPSILFILLSMQSNYKAVGFPELTATEITIREWGHEVKAAYSTWLLPAAVGSAQENIYFLEVSGINNVLSVGLYEKEQEMQRRRVGREIVHSVKKAWTRDHDHTLQAVSFNYSTQIRQQRRQFTLNWKRVSTKDFCDSGHVTEGSSLSSLCPIFTSKAHTLKVESVLMIKNHMTR